MADQRDGTYRIVAAIIPDDLPQEPREVFGTPDGTAQDLHGGRAIVLARFAPFVRTYAPVAAGVGRMPYRHFVSYNVIGALLWGVGITVLGYFLGQITFVHDNIEAILVLIVLVSVLPIIIEVARGWLARRRAPRDTAASVPTTTPEV